MDLRWALIGMQVGYIGLKVALNKKKAFAGSESLLNGAGKLKCTLRTAIAIATPTATAGASPHPNANVPSSTYIAMPRFDKFRYNARTPNRHGAISVDSRTVFTSAPSAGVAIVTTSPR